MATVKLGIIGFGRIVELIHLPIIKKFDDIEVVGVFDITDSRLKIAEKRNLNTYSNLDVFLEEDMNAVLIATPPNSHCEIAKKAISAGKHILMEKPLTINYEEAKIVKEMSEQVGIGVTVFLNHRFDPDFLFIKDVIERNMLGQPTFIQRNYHTNKSGSDFGVKSFNPAWRVQKSFGGGALLDWGVHLIDQLLSLQLGKVKDVMGQALSLPNSEGEADDYVNANLLLENNTLLTFNINFRTTLPQPCWIVGGDKGTLQLRDQEALVQWADGETSRYIIDKPSKFSASKIYQSFIDFIKEGRPLLVSMEVAVQGMEIIDRIQTQSNTQLIQA